MRSCRKCSNELKYTHQLSFGLLYIFVFSLLDICIDAFRCAVQARGADERGLSGGFTPTQSQESMMGFFTVLAVMGRVFIAVYRLMGSTLYMSIKMLS